MCISALPSIYRVDIRTSQSLIRHTGVAIPPRGDMPKNRVLITRGAACHPIPDFIRQIVSTHRYGERTDADRCAHRRRFRRGPATGSRRYTPVPRQRAGLGIRLYRAIHRRYLPQRRKAQRRHGCIKSPQQDCRHETLVRRRTGRLKKAELPTVSAEKVPKRDPRGRTVLVTSLRAPKSTASHVRG